jgi:hypothetical protein
MAGSTIARGKGMNSPGTGLVWRLRKGSNVIDAIVRSRPGGYQFCLHFNRRLLWSETIRSADVRAVMALAEAEQQSHEANGWLPLSSIGAHYSVS